MSWKEADKNKPTNYKPIKIFLIENKKKLKKNPLLVSIESKNYAVSNSDVFFLFERAKFVPHTRYTSKVNWAMV